MIKIYKRIVLNQSAGDPRLTADNSSSGLLWRKWLAIPAMVAGTLVGVVVFSAFFALLLIPLTIVAARAWWAFRKLKQARSDSESIHAEYTVIKDDE